MPHALATPMPHIWYHADRHDQWKRVAWPVFFVKDRGLALAPRMCPRPITDLQTGQILIGIYCRKKKWAIFFSGPAASRCSKACLYKISRKNSKNWMRRSNNESNFTPKIEYILKTSNYNAKPWFLYLTTQKKRPRRFWELDPEIFAHVFNVTLPSLIQMFFFFFLRRKCGFP